MEGGWVKLQRQGTYLDWMPQSASLQKQNSRELFRQESSEVTWWEHLWREETIFSGTCLLPNRCLQASVSRLCSCRMLSGFQAEGRTRLPGGLINSLMAGASFPTVPEKWNVLRSSWSNPQVKLILFSGQQAWHWQNSARFGLETMPPIWPAWIMLWLLSMIP